MGLGQADKVHFQALEAAHERPRVYKVPRTEEEGNSGLLLSQADEALLFNLRNCLLRHACLIMRLLVVPWYKNWRRYLDHYLVLSKFKTGQ